MAALAAPPHFFFAQSKKCVYLCRMKNIKLTIEEARAALAGRGFTKESLETILETLTAASKTAPKWLVIALKTLAYLIGLLLAGYGTEAAAATIFHF